MTKGVRAIRAEASPHGHDVSTVPRREPRRRFGSARTAAAASHWLARSAAENSRRVSDSVARAGPQPRASPPTRTPSPESYTPKHLAEKILTSRSALEGERKQVTVLFADLKGSMELLADRDPEEARQLLDPVLERMMEAVHRYEGTVNQVMGDGIMALFGAPARPRRPRRARLLRRAAHAGGACSATPRRCAARTASTVQIRVGLNSGEVVVRAIGNDLHMDYTAVGQTTHLAARMEQLATPGSDPAHAPTRCGWPRATSQVKPLGPVPVKGLAEPVEVFELVGAGAGALALAGRRGARASPASWAATPSWSTLRAGAGAGRRRARPGGGVVGEPGVGKSRLVWEFTHSHRTQGWLVLESGSVSYGKATPLPPGHRPAQALLSASRTATTPRTIREKVTGQAADARSRRSQATPAGAARAAGRAGRTMPPGERSTRRSAASARSTRVKRLLLRESQVQPLLLVFEDLHWIDAETQALLDSLVESLPTARLLLLVNYRPEYQHGWGSKTYYTQLRLDPLPPESAEELLHGAARGRRRAWQPLKRLLIERTEGNPFFLEESVRTLVETGVLVGERGRLSPGAGRCASIQVPATVQAVLAARIDRLPPEDKRLLQTAAVIGKDVPVRRCCRPSPSCPRTALQPGSRPPPGRRVPLRDAACSPSSSTPSSTPSPTRWPTAASSRSGGARCTRASSRPSSGSTPDRLAEQVERLAAPCPAGRGVGQGPALLPPGRGQGRGARRPTARPWRTSSRRWVPSSISRRAATPWKRPSICASTFGLRSTRSANMSASSTTSAKPKRSPSPSTISVSLGRVYSYMTQHFWLIGDQDRAVESGQHDARHRHRTGRSCDPSHRTFYLGRASLARGDYAAGD